MNTYESMPRSLSFTPANINANGFATAVTGASWPLTATASGDSLAHKVTITNNSSNSKASIDIVLVGTDENGNAQTETLTGPGASVAVTSTKYYLTLTSATPASTWGADTAGIGWAGAFASAWLNVNWLAEDILSLVADVTGTINFTLNQTFDLYNQPGVTARWRAVASAQTADGIWQTTGGATAVQFIANSYSNGATTVLNANATFVPNAVLPGSEVDISTVGGSPIALGQAAMASSLPVVIASDQSTLTVQQAGYSFANITTSTTTTVKSGAGVLHLVNVNADGTVASTVTIYDNTAGSGTKIATIDSLTLSGPFQYDIEFSTGLTLVTTGAPDITVSYR